MMQLLAGDIGGTKTILRLVQSGTNPQETLHEQRFVSGDYADLVPMVKDFLAAVSNAQPQAACFAIAGPVVNNRSQLTNLAWSLSGDRIADELGLKTVELINDFAAVGYGVLGLTSDDVCTLQSGTHDDQAPIAIIGAGTGLGQGFLINCGGQYQVFPSEGGHADFAPRSELEFQLLHYLLDKHSISRVSVERVVSGQGIVSIYQFLRDRNFATESEELAQVVRNWEQGAGKRSELPDPAAAISKAATVDRLAGRTMEIFIDAYGAAAGNLALKLLPYGGLYVAGGVTAKNMPLIRDGSFLTAFSHKGRVGPLLDNVPIHLVTNQSVGLIGAALRAGQLA
ncbi:glucokinase [Leptolyngbyaceae cyanobacterium CCMR0082]|uniref:Glucokinase n=2 Tax=Adonisia turfae TaxID=2950184 RepID=A0A6M0SBH7_9CYAN|nr:glucokinase [Adonisia turfae]NEZ55209.1 glucokinase [Adonisia turfae CCMR0081]NEZ65858.1 glucokinase [Adonisia turfae CCMR0082]